jgi:cell wall-associated NlpC family hydrolase
MTAASVAAFKQAHNMVPANGVAGPAFVTALRAAISAYTADVPTGTTQINADGTGTAPTNAPPAVQAMVTAANQIIDTSYCVGGGHGHWQSSCYDCSGTVSYVLHAAGLLSSSEDSSGLESYGAAGPGRWVTIYSDPSHVFIVIAGRAFDTANYGGPNIPSGTGPRWRHNPLGNLADGGNYVVRHPPGL